MSITHPAIDIVIPSFNRAYCLARALDSVIAQSYPHWQLWLIDDGSTDDTQALIESYQKSDARIHYLKTANFGVSRARNLGASLGKAPWLAFLDSDDEWLPQKLTQQLAFATTHPEFSLIYGDEIWMRKGKRVNPKATHQKRGGELFIDSLAQCLIGPSTVLIKRDLFNEQGGFDPEFIACEDYDLWLKITSCHEVGFINTPLIIKHGGHPDQLSTSTDCLDYWRLRSLDWIYEQRRLTPAQSEALIATLLKKAEILANGYRKRDKQAELLWLNQLVAKYQA